MTIFDPISGRQITVDLSAKPCRPIIRQEGFAGGEQQVRAGQRSRAGEGLKSPDPSPRKRFNA
ncbi:hypothetical protein [Microvirga sp. BSC39]|uniref:hypothetical protein n=1 Tax=Microvirga sp. BSC39 TaxID=1549810 RepID=UPI000AFC0793|nr:hypothetical protein [Microvirga sp. BSC39]